MQTTKQTTWRGVWTKMDTTVTQIMKLNIRFWHWILMITFFLDTFNNCDYFSYLFLINRPRLPENPGVKSKILISKLFDGT